MDEKILRKGSCIAWCTHRLDAAVLQGFYRLADQCHGKIDTYLVYDNSRHDFRLEGLTNGTRYWLFDLLDMKKQFNLFRYEGRTGITPGNTIFPLLSFFQQTAYEYYWLVEYDVNYSWHWSTFFQAFQKNRSDLLGTTLARYPEQLSWQWWASFRKPFFPMICKRDWMRGFFPIMRLSAKACELLTKINRQGWIGHHEVVIPTALLCHGLKVEDIGGKNDFVSPENVYKHYIGQSSQTRCRPGTFVCLPSESLKERIPNKLYHPVKNFDSNDK